MITIHKQEVATWVLMDCLSTLHTVREKLRLFERKYNQSWNMFEQKVKTSKKENFSKWDDYIEWKAYVRMSQDITHKIEEVRHGHFEVA